MFSLFKIIVEENIKKYEMQFLFLSYLKFNWENKYKFIKSGLVKKKKLKKDSQ